MPNVNDVYLLEVTFANGKGSAKGNMMYLYSTSRFEATYGFDGELGAIYSKSSTTFKVWSPIATSMKLRIYATGTPSYLGGNDTYTEYDMTLGTKGVWSKTVTGDLSGKYYTYVVSNFMYDSQELVDPYAKSAGVNGLRGMVVDFESVNPEGWDSIQTLDINPGDLAVYEAHIADLTSSSTWGGNPLLSKTYLGFCEEGTTYTSGGTTVTTGFDHIKELGVNAVQLLPIFDSANDEINPSFNWGYNPLNYNSLDGSYSTNPYDGYEKIREFKQLVMKYNQAGITIIMDVVFNHVSDAAASNFTHLMPGYYYRYNADGYLYNGSGCGNETASDRLMYHNFMIDSTEFWATEYKLGGFRFDLMGIHDVETMQDLADNLHTKINSNIVVYGEPWAASGEEYVTATLCNLSNYSTWGNFGSFNSTIRDAMFGQVGTSGSYGWGSTTGVDSNNLYKIMNGCMGYMYDDRANPVQYTVAYISCHDNYNVYDHLATCGFSASDAVKASTLGHAIVLTSQGISFMQEGEEFLRTKDGNENSYNASYAVNDLDYSYKVTYNSMFQNFKALVELKTSGDITVSLSAISAKRNTIAYDDTNFSYFYYTVGDYVIMHHNGYNSKLTVSGYTGYTVYLDTLGYMSGMTVSTDFELNPYQTIILKKN
jgi:pullulanase